MPFDQKLFDPQVFSAESQMSFTCVFDSAIFDGAVFDACVDAPEVRVINVGAGVDAKSWQEAVTDRFQQLHGRLEVAVKEQTKVTRKLAVVRKKAEKPEVPAGILMNLHLLEAKKQELRREIKDLRLQIKWVNIEIEDEEDEEILLLH